MGFTYAEDEYYEKLWKPDPKLPSPIFHNARGKVYRHYAASYDFHSLYRPKKGYCAVLALMPDGTGAFVVSYRSATVAVRVKLVERDHPATCNIFFNGDPQLSEESMKVLKNFDSWCFRWDTSSDEDEPTDPFGMALHLTSIGADQLFEFDGTLPNDDEGDLESHATRSGDVVVGTPNSDWLGHHIFRPVTGVQLENDADVVQIASDVASNSALNSASGMSIHMK